MDKVLEELHRVSIEFEEAFKAVVNSLPLVGLFCILLLLTGVLVLEVARDALGQVGIDEMTNEGLESSPTFLFSSQGNLFLLLDSVVTVGDGPLIDGMEYFVWLNLQRKKHLDDLLASLIRVHAYLSEVTARLPDLKVAVNDLVGELLGHWLQERDDASLDLVEVSAEVRL